MESFSGRISNLRLCALGGFAALGAFFSGFVVAQNAQGPEPSVLAEVIVTAQYREEKLQDTPIAITALTSDMIEEQGATKLSDILTSAPSVVFRQQSAAFGQSVTAFIRGFGQADFDPAFEPGVGLYIDDVYYPRLTGANFDLMDVERVEVLRGPQGTLEGRNSEGGAIRFVTRKPTGDGSGYATVTYGTRNRLEMRAGADFKLLDHLSARIAGTFADQDGYVDVYSYGCLFPGSGVPAPSGGTKCNQYSLGDTRLPRRARQPAFQPLGPVRRPVQRRLHPRGAQQRCGNPAVRQQQRQSQHEYAQWHAFRLAFPVRQVVQLHHALGLLSSDTGPGALEKKKNVSLASTPTTPAPSPARSPPPGTTPAGPGRPSPARSGSASTSPGTRCASRRVAAERLGPAVYLGFVRERAAVLAGLAESTMSRDDGWRFLVLGRSLERVDMTARLLSIDRHRTRRDSAGRSSGAPCCAPAAPTSRSCAPTAARCVPQRVAEFLLLDRLFPRSALHALTEAEECLEALAPTTERAGMADAARRPIGQARTRLEYADAATLLDELPSHLRALQRACAVGQRRRSPPATSTRPARSPGPTRGCDDGLAAAHQARHRLHLRRHRARLVQRGPDDPAHDDAARPRCSARSSACPARPPGATATTGAPRSPCSTCSARTSSCGSPRPAWSRRPTGPGGRRRCPGPRCGRSPLWTSTRRRSPPRR